MVEKLFTLIDPKTGDVSMGLANQPADNGNFITGGLRSIGDGPKNWRDLELNESVMVQDKAGDVYRMFRVQ